MASGIFSRARATLPVQAAHEPTDAGQTFAPSFDDQIQLPEFRLALQFPAQVAMHQWVAFVQAQAAMAMAKILPSRVR